MFLPYLLGSLGAAIVLAYAVTKQPPGLEWNYYPAKLAWIWVLVGFPLLLAPAAFLQPLPWMATVRSHLGRIGAASVASLAVLAGASASSPVASPLLPPAAGALAAGYPGYAIQSGWQRPDWRIADAVFSLGAIQRPVVLWDYLDPGNDRMGNYWLVIYDQLLPGPGTRSVRFYEWAANENGVDVAQLCDLLRGDPDRIVATRNPGLPRVVQQQCGVPASRVVVDPEPR